MAENFDVDSSFSSWLDTYFNSKLLPVLLSKGEVATSRIKQHYSQPGNEMEKTLSELVETNNVLYVCMYCLNLYSALSHGTESRSNDAVSFPIWKM